MDVLLGEAEESWALWFPSLKIELFFLPVLPAVPWTMRQHGQVGPSPEAAPWSLALYLLSVCLSLPSDYSPFSVSVFFFVFLSLILSS